MLINHYSWWPLPADRALSVTVSKGKEGCIYQYVPPEATRENQVGQIRHEPVSPEQNQRTGSLAQSVMLQLPTTLCSWLPEPASPEVGRHKTRAQGREKGVSEALAKAGPHKGALVQVSILAEQCINIFKKAA